MIGTFSLPFKVCSFSLSLAARSSWLAAFFSLAAHGSQLSAAPFFLSSALLNRCNEDEAFINQNLSGDRFRFC